MSDYRKEILDGFRDAENGLEAARDFFDLERKHVDMKAKTLDVFKEVTAKKHTPENVEKMVGVLLDLLFVEYGEEITEPAKHVLYSVEERGERRGRGRRGRA